MLYDVIIFDTDGTLLKSMPRKQKLNIINQKLREQGINCKYNEILDAYNEANRFFDLAAPFIIDESDLWCNFIEVILIILDIFQDQNEQVHQISREIAKEILNGTKNSIYPDSIKLCSFLFYHDVKLYAVSSSNNGNIRLSNTKLFKFFTNCYSAENGSPKGYQIFNIINRHPNSEILYIGNDLISDYFLPKIMGCDVILLDRGNKRPNRIKKIKSLSEILQLWREKNIEVK